MERSKMTITWNDKQITFEGPTDFIEEQANKFRLQETKHNNNFEHFGDTVPSNASQMVSAKRPKGHHEIVAVLAFFLHEQGFDEFSEQDMKKAYLQARVRPPKVIAQSLRDAKNKFDFLENSGKKGHYKLSAHGDRTVRYDLPRLDNSN